MDGRMSSLRRRLTPEKKSDNDEGGSPASKTPAPLHDEKMETSAGKSSDSLSGASSSSPSPPMSPLRMDEFAEDRMSGLLLEYGDDEDDDESTADERSVRSCSRSSGSIGSPRKAVTNTAPNTAPSSAHSSSSDFFTKQLQTKELQTHQQLQEQLQQAKEEQEQEQPEQEDSEEKPKTPWGRTDVALCNHCNKVHPVNDTEDVYCTKEELGVLAHLFAAASLGLISGCPQALLLVVLLGLPFALWWGSATLATLIVLITSTCWLPIRFQMPSITFIRSSLFKSWRRYFRFQATITAPLDPSRKFMFVEVPHGIMPLGSILSAAVMLDAFPDLSPVSCVAAEIVLRIPILRHFYKTLGVRPADKKNISGMYEDGMHVGIIVGGIAEMHLASREEERLYLLKRKGFVRLAIQEGADMVPVIFYGNSLLFDLAGGRQGNGLLRLISRKIKAAMVVYYGRFGLTIPYRTPLTMVSGSPMVVKQEADPSEETVDTVHTAFVEAVKAMYEEHRPEWEARPLVVY